MVENGKHHIGGSWVTLSNRMKDGVAILKGTSDCCVEDECPI